MNLLGFGKEKLPSCIRDPFNKMLIKDIYVRFYEWNGVWGATGKVEFKNGNTKGEQRFEGQTFDDVVRQIKAMIDNL